MLNLQIYFACLNELLATGFKQTFLKFSEIDDAFRLHKNSCASFLFRHCEHLKAEIWMLLRSEAKEQFLRCVEQYVMIAFITSKHENVKNCSLFHEISCISILGKLAI